jgi:hypothetical protein
MLFLPGDPPPRPGGAGPVAAGFARELEGPWKQAETKKPNLVRFEPARMVQFRDGELRFVRVAYKDGQIIRQGIGGAREPLGRFVVAGNELLLTDPAGRAHKFARLAKAPPELALVPVRIAPAKPIDRKKAREVQRELARREEAGRKLRQDLRDALKDAPRRAATIKEMLRADADDTRYLIGLLKEVGWIDGGRFGHAARDSAVIILLHTPEPALKAAVLPILKEDVMAGRFDAETYAGLYDRYCFQVGLPDRYGMHLSPDEAGQLVVGPLEDRARVDAFRKEIGLLPLARYLERRRAENGGRPIRIID